MFALSTSWNALRYSRAKDFINEIKDLGFTWVELSCNLTSAQVKETASLWDRGLIKVISVHNFCPIPSGLARKDASPDIFSLSSLDEQEREKAVRYTKKTIQTAARVGAEAVVLHAGKVKMKEKIRELATLYQSNDQRSYNQLKAQMIKERALKAKQHLTQTLRSLEPLCRLAQRLKVKLGLENRYYFREIPSPEEMAIILDAFSSPPLYYWHDVGHAQVYENLNLLKHTAILDKFSQRMLGIHLHDIEGMDDHRPPLKGKFNFQLLKPYLTKDTIKVLEPHYPATAEEIIAGKKYLEKLFKV